MALKDWLPMAGGLPGTIASVVFGIALFVAGFLELPVCGQGLSLILFGLGILAFGTAVYPAGGFPVLGMTILLFLLLLAVGLVFGYQYGCGY